MSDTDILVLIYPPEGRDPEAIIPLAWYLENVFQYKIKYGSIFDSRYLIDKYKPKALLLNNMSGSEFNVLACDYAYDKGVKVVSLTSEGLFREKDMGGFIWGNNYRKKLDWHLMFVWSKKFLSLSQEFLPQYKKSFLVSGSTGIDRYKIYSFMSKQKFLEKYNKKHYKKIVMYAGFTFGNFFNQNFLNQRNISKKESEFYRNEMLVVKNIIQSLIRNSPDILFILKQHPGEDSLHMEIDHDLRFDNVMIFDEQETLADLINVSDIYFVYRSTTAFEAYALNKPVINIFPTLDLKTVQSDQLGNCVVRTYLEGQSVIKEYFKTGKIKEFEKKENLRKKIISENIGSDDGLNSFRVATKIHKFMSKQNTLVNNYFSWRGLIIHIILKWNKLLFLLPRFRHSDILEKYNNFNDFYKLKLVYKPQIEKHYLRNIKKKQIAVEKLKDFR